ncbi:MAG: putative lipid II flippase FtsW [Bdellovibrionota bacterium]
MIIRSLSSSLLLAVMALLGIGLVQVYSSSYIFATESYGDGLYFFKRQLFFTAISLVALFTMINIPFRLIEKYGWMMWLFSSALVLATFIPGLGVRVGGALRWLQLPLGLRFEPSELLKVSLSFFAASLLAKTNPLLKGHRFWALFVLAVAPLFLLLKQPDFGSFAIICAVSIFMLFAFGLKWRFLVAAVAIAVPTFYFLVMTVPYRRARVLAFLDPWADPETKGFQVIQSMLSFHSGGIWGAGLGQGQGKLFFLPEAHTDFTLAVLGEEMGFVGFCAVMLLYAFVVYKAFQISMKTEEPFKRALALGLGLTFGLSVFINSGVVMGLLPTKGLTLPFLSYGGSSLMVFSFLFGLLLNIENSITNEWQDRWRKQITKES